MNSSDRTGMDPEEVHPFEQLPPQAGLGPVGQGTVAAAAALIGAAYPPSAAVLAGVGAFLPALGQRLGRVQHEKTAELLAGAIAESTLTAEDVVQQLVERDDLALLAAEAVDAARRSRLAGKASALGRSLGAILQDDARIDRESIWIRILSVIEPPHIRVLKYFVNGKKLRLGGTYWTPGVEVSVRTVSEGLGLEDAVLPLVQDLLRCGLLITPGGIDGGTPELVYTPDGLNEELRATQLGAELFVRLELAAEDL